MELDELERRLEASMTRRAAATAVRPGGLDAVRTRMRRKTRQRRMAQAGASALVLVAAGALMVSTNGGSAPRGVGFSPMVPIAVPDGFTLTAAGPILTPDSPNAYTAIVYRDEAGARRAVVQTEQGGTAPTPNAGAGREVIEIDGRPGLLTTYGPQRYLTWQPTTDALVAVTFAGIERDEAVALATSLRVEPLGAGPAIWVFGEPGALSRVGERDDLAPTGGYRFELRGNGSGAASERRVSVVVARTDPGWLDYLRTFAIEQPGVDVGGRPAIVLAENPALPQEGTYAQVLWWIGDVLVEVDSTNMTVDETVAVARSLRPAEDDEWATFVASAAGS